MNKAKRDTTREGQAGSVLVLTLLVTLVILGVGLTAMWMATSATKVTGNINRRLEAMNAAEAGIFHAREVLIANIDDWNTLIAGTGTPCASKSWEGDDKGRVLCDGTDELEREEVVESSSSTFARASIPNANQITYTVYIRNDDDEAEAAGGSYQVDVDRRVVIRSEGRGRDAMSYVALEAVFNAAWLEEVIVKSYQSEGMGRGGASASRQ
jgi:hypothetical protein